MFLGGGHRGETLVDNIITRMIYDKGKGNLPAMRRSGGGQGFDCDDGGVELPGLVTMGEDK